MRMSAQPSAAVITASIKLEKFQKGIWKETELVVNANVNQRRIHILDVVGFCSTTSRKGDGVMGELTEKGKKKGREFQEVTPQPGNFRWKKD